MKFDIITTFPEMIQPMLDCSIIKKALKNELLEVNVVQLRDFTTDRHSVTDDYSYGGGSGMVMKAEPVLKALDHLRTDESFIIYMSPRGRQLVQHQVKKLALKKHIILLCGHYEDIDHRAIACCDAEISVGDYVLTGGEIPAMIVVDAVTRCIPDVIKQDSLERDSFYNGLLDHHHYTRPAEIAGTCVPAVLTSGDHARIEAYRYKESLALTAQRRPEMLSEVVLTYEDIETILGE